MVARRNAVIVGTLASVIAIVGVAAAGLDIGQEAQKRIEDRSTPLFGFETPVAQSSTVSANLADAIADPTELVTFAKGLNVNVVTSGQAAPVLDQMVLWPPTGEPTHIIACNEQGATAPAVQRIELATGAAETILTGMTSCDPVKVTPWGTVIVAEEAGASGQMLEIADPLHTTGVQFNRVAHTVSGTDAGNVAVRLSVGTTSFEGIVFTPTGVMYYADENRPSNGVIGGAYFKFIPTTPWDGSTMIETGADLGSSPLVSGTVYGLRVGKRGQPAGSTASGNDYGQGTETGLGAWINLCSGAACNAFDLRAAASANKLTGYYRPEDAEIDHPSFAAGNVKFCANNTGNEGEDHSWGETICITDGTFAQSLANAVSPEVQFFVIGTSDLAMPDNIAQQPVTNNWVIHEDGDTAATGKNNDLFICLPDGADADGLTDGCVRMATLNDLPTNDPASANHGEGAEWTGGFFDPTGEHFFVSVQHNMTGFGVILDITGFKNLH
jgi:Alkaline phosphatase PhoX